MDPAQGDRSGRSGGDQPDAVLEPLYRCALEVEGKTSLQLRAWVRRAEAWRIVQALRECRGNRTAAARALGIGRRTLYNKIDQFAAEPWAAPALRSESGASEAP